MIHAAKMLRTLSDGCRRWLWRFVGLAPISWNSGPALTLPFWLSYSDQDEDGMFERWETVFVLLRRCPRESFEPVAYFWRYDGRRRLMLRLPAGFFLSAGRDYTDLFKPNAKGEPRRDDNR